jgi:hypothetical protein
VHISHEHTKTVYCKSNSNNIQFAPKKKNKMLHSEMPQSEMLAGFRDATCFSLPELTSKEPDRTYANGSLKIGFHQRMSMKFHIWKLSP